MALATLKMVVAGRQARHFRRQRLRSISMNRTLMEFLLWSQIIQLHEIAAVYILPSTR